jgi:hypothetical protein
LQETALAAGFGKGIAGDESCKSIFSGDEGGGGRDIARIAKIAEIAKIEDRRGSQGEYDAKT